MIIQDWRSELIKREQFSYKDVETAFEEVINEWEKLVHEMETNDNDKESAKIGRIAIESIHDFEVEFLARLTNNKETSYRKD